MSRWPSDFSATLWRSRWRARLRTWRHPSCLCLTPPVGAAISPLGVPVHDEALKQWRSWCEAHAGRQVRLSLSARWLLSTALPDAGQGRTAVVQAQAEAVSRWSHFLGMDDAAWQARWTTRAVTLPQGVLVCAVPQALVDDVLAVAAHHHVVVQWLGPWWAQGLNQWLTAGKGLPATRTLLMRESAWAVHVQASGTHVTRLWGEPDAGEPCVGGESMSLISTRDAGDVEGLSLAVRVLPGSAAAWKADA